VRNVEELAREIAKVGSVMCRFATFQAEILFTMLTRRLTARDGGIADRADWPIVVHDHVRQTRLSALHSLSDSLSELCHRELQHTALAGPTGPTGL